ncbi:SMI1/KNR4 family protein [Streptomyces rubellomurinus]|uniref:Bifunctional protein n=1 Tax=Streptomyces rubellomurinus (strain ATCC 31215) TaxID=359131 RepID=A0A0F2TIJ2_STRR3|nr:cell wall assembly regulator [Streptomyces rubellomurinus]KJS63063.1 bifunctional protein [Streptomyces rubellomurinus]
MSTLNDFTTWEPLLRLLRASHAERLAAPGGRVSGRIGQHGWSVPLRRPAGAEPDDRAERDAVDRVRAALVEAAMVEAAFTVEIPPSGRTVLRLLDHGPAVDPGLGNAHPGALTLVEDAVPAPWRRLPDPAPGARLAPSVDLELLERTLRERLPDETGATEEEIAAAEARLGVALPEELKVLYRVTRADWYDDLESGEDFALLAEASERVGGVLGFELSSLNWIFTENRSRSRFRWEHAATQVCVTAPDAAVQDLVWSPGWIVIGDTGGGDLVAVDLTPGPRGHLGQLIVLGHEDSVGGDLFAESLTEAVLGPGRDWYSGRNVDKSPVLARIYGRQSMSVEAVAHPDLEVLTLGGSPEPFSLAPLVGLPGLRTLSAGHGMLADPREIGGLTGLEFLELTPRDWRVLLDAGAVPRSLSAAAVVAYGEPDPCAVIRLANEILALWDRPQITETVVEGELGPVS